MAPKLFFASLLGLAAAQTTTLSLPFIGYDSMPIAASIISANVDATTLQIACVPGTDASDCGLFPQQTLVIGPSTYHMDEADGPAFTGTEDCVIAPTGAVCKESNGGSEANFPGSSTETYDASDIVTLPVTVTAGAEKLSGLALATPTGSAVGSSGASAKASAIITSGASRTTASATQSTRSGGSSGSASVSKSGSAPATNPTAAAAANIVALGDSLFGVAAGLLGGYLL